MQRQSRTQTTMETRILAPLLVETMATPSVTGTFPIIAYILIISFHGKQLSASGQLIAFAGNQGEGGEPAISLAKSPLHSVTMQDDIEMELHYTGMITSTKCRPCEPALMSWMKGDTLLASSGVFEEHSGSKRSTYWMMLYLMQLFRRQQECSHTRR